LYLIY
jgi:hypothetical protein